MKGFALLAIATAVVVLALADQGSAQTVTTAITQDNVTQSGVSGFNPIIVYGQKPSFEATLVASNGTTAVPTSCSFMWMNGTQTISALPSLAQAATSSAVTNPPGLAFSWTEPNVLAAGIYDAVHAVFPGCTVSNTTYLPTDSRLSPTLQVPYDAFLKIMPANTSLTATYTHFNLANFTQSIFVNLTNVNGTDQQPQGPSYAVITDSSGNLVGNFSMTATGINTNTLALTLPSTFNGTQLLKVGTYTEVITYYPTSNFNQPTPLSITFQITNPLPPSPPPPPPKVFHPPPPPSVSPSPPTPPSPSNLVDSTTITVEVFYNQVSDFLQECRSRTLYFAANVGATSLNSGYSGPTDGTITFIDGSGTVLAQGPATPCGQGKIGLTVSFNNLGGSYGIGYGPHSVVAAYSGSTDGYWLPSKATADYVIPDTCSQQNLATEIAGQKQMFDNALQSVVGTWMNTGTSNGPTTVVYTPGGCTTGSCVQSQCTGAGCSQVTGGLPSVTGGYTSSGVVG